MRLRKGRIVLVTLTDGTVIRGRAAWSWRWHVVRVVDAEAVTSHGDIPTAGDVLIPWRSIVLAQEVMNE